MLMELEAAQEIQAGIFLIQHADISRGAGGEMSTEVTNVEILQHIVPTVRVLRQI
jgi:hypothetical protein